MSNYINNFSSMPSNYTYIRSRFVTTIINFVFNYQSWGNKSSQHKLDSCRVKYNGLLSCSLKIIKQQNHYEIIFRVCNFIFLVCHLTLKLTCHHLDSKLFTSRMSRNRPCKFNPLNKLRNILRNYMKILTLKKIISNLILILRRIV